LRPFVPKLILSRAQLDAAVDDLLAHSSFVVDVETVGGLNPLRNEVTWIGLRTDAAVHIIPLRHPNGHMLTPPCSRREYDPSTRRPKKNNPAELTKGKIHMVHHPATFGPPPKQLRPDIVFDALRPVFFSDRLIINHNLRYDLKSMAKYWGGELPPGPYADTQVGVHLVDENLPQKGLKPITRGYYLGPNASVHKIAQRFYPEMGKAGVENFSLADAARYVAQDVTFTYRLHQRNMQVITGEEMTAAWELDMELYGLIMRMEMSGVAIDVDSVRALDAHLCAEIAQIEIDAARITGVKFNLGNINEKRKYLFGPKEEGGQGLKPLNTTKTGLPQLNEEALRKFAEKNPLAGLFMEHGKLEKLRSAFVEPFLNGNLLDGGRVRTHLNLARTDTGRISSSEPNLQQIPARSELGKEFRKCFVAQPGSELIVADYSQIELRVAAYVAQDPEMIRVLSTGEDIHRAAVAGALQKPVDEVTDEERSVIGKVVNFLIIYGGGAKKLQKSVQRPLDECEEIIANYFKTFSRLEPMKARIIRDAIERGDRSRPHRQPPYVIVPPTGRRRRLPGLFSSDEYEVFRAQRQAVNAVIQGFAANIMKMALVNVDRALREVDSGARVLLTVHDEIMVETPESEAKAVYDLVIEEMNNVALPSGSPILGPVPLLAEGGIGHTWVDAK
jgi:DNA polymerase I-like protein with 3'-5' exonuclease and polymerase domains